LGAVAGGLTGLAVVDYPLIKAGLGSIQTELHKLFTADAKTRGAEWADIGNRFAKAFDWIGDQMAKGTAYMIEHGRVWGLEILRGVLRGIDKVVPQWVSDIGEKIAGLFNKLRSYLPAWMPGSNAPPAPGAPTPQLEKHSSLVPPQAPIHLTVNLTNQLDGRKIAQSTMSYAVASATYPTSAAGADSRGTWMGPSWSPTEQG